jgi:periplasmic divalent cation tolerance protein
VSTPNEALVVLTTVESAADGARLARLLVEQEVAGCVQMLPPMTSIYRWQGQIEEASEILLFIKTTRAVYEQLEVTLKQNHPYQTPEIIALPVVAGSAEYLTWLTGSIKSINQAS